MHACMDAGVVQGWAAILMGMISGSVPWYTMMVLHDKVGLLRHVDDPMAVFHTHAVAGSLGGVLTGFFAVPKLCRLFYMVPDWDKYVGLAYALQTGRTAAGFRQMGLQLLGIAFVVAVNVAATSLICMFVRLIVPLRLAEDEMESGDMAVHGEVGFGLLLDVGPTSITSAARDGRFEINVKHNAVYGGAEERYSSLSEVQLM